MRQDATFTVRLTQPLRIRAAEAARKEGISLQSWVRRVIEKALREV